MSRLRTVNCDCEKCVAMCKRYPCRPLPREVAKMPPEVRARLMSQSEGQGLSGVPHLQTAARGFEGGEAPEFFVAWGMIGMPRQCTFLTPDGKCELHGKCKPYEGRVADCRKSHAKSVLPNLERAWRGKVGRKVLADWKEEQEKREQQENQQ